MVTGWRGLMTLAAPAIVGIVVAACGGESDRPRGRLGGTAPHLPTSRAVGADGRLTPEAITREMIARGDSIFHGLSHGGTCSLCHGPAGQGDHQAPNLQDDVWLNGDGSYEWIVQVIQRGIAPPRVYSVAMPPDGGGSLTTQEERAVAAYVYSLRSRDR